MTAIASPSSPLPSHMRSTFLPLDHTSGNVIRRPKLTRVEQLYSPKTPSEDYFTPRSSSHKSLYHPRPGAESRMVNYGPQSPYESNGYEDEGYEAGIDEMLMRPKKPTQVAQKVRFVPEVEEVEVMRSPKIGGGKRERDEMEEGRGRSRQRIVGSSAARSVRPQLQTHKLYHNRGALVV